MLKENTQDLSFVRFIDYYFQFSSQRTDIVLN